MNNIWKNIKNVGKFQIKLIKTYCKISKKFEENIKQFFGKYD